MGLKISFFRQKQTDFEEKRQEKQRRDDDFGRKKEKRVEISRKLEVAKEETNVR